MAEWLNAPVLKTGIVERLSGVRIPVPPHILVLQDRIEYNGISSPLKKGAFLYVPYSIRSNKIVNDSIS